MGPKITEFLTFEDILNREEYTICDASISSPMNANWYEEGVYRARNFVGIDSELVGREIENLKFFIEFLKNPNVYVAKGVSFQLQNARDIVADKIRYLKTERKNERGRKYQNGENQANLLQEVHDMLYESCREAKRVSFLPKERQKYNSLEKIVVNVAEQTGARIDLNEIYDQRAKPKKVEDFHADEQTVAAALYFSIIENKKGCILTRNSDIERILTNTLFYFFYSNRSQFNRFFSIVRTNKIGIYFVSNSRKGEFIFDSRNFLPSSKNKEVISVIDNKAN